MLDNEEYITEHLAKTRPSAVTEIAGWSWDLEQTLGGPDPNVFAIWALSGLPLPAGRCPNQRLRPAAEMYGVDRSRNRPNPHCI